MTLVTSVERRASYVKKIALLLPTDYEDDPVIDYDRSVIDWEKLHIDCWHYSAGDVESDIGPQTLAVNHPAATSWDFYSVPGTWGIVSDRMWLCLKDYAKGFFDTWPISLDGESFYVLRRTGKVNCLDHDRCGQYQDGNHIDYDPYEFDESKVPESALFSIPESSFLFATEDVADLVVENDFKGVEVYNARGHRRMIQNMEW